MSCVSTFVSVATVDVVKASSGQFPPVCGDKTGIFKQVMQKSTSSTSYLGTVLFLQMQLETFQTSLQKYPEVHTLTEVETSSRTTSLFWQPSCRAVTPPLSFLL